MREISVVEQRYHAVLAVIADGRTVSEVAGQWSVSRQTAHSWLARYEAAGLSGLADRSHLPVSCPHQLDGEVVDIVLGLRALQGFSRIRRPPGIYDGANCA
jgi:transposase